MIGDTGLRQADREPDRSGRRKQQDSQIVDFDQVMIEILSGVKTKVKRCRSYIDIIPV